MSSTYIDPNRAAPITDIEKQAVADALDDQYSYHAWTKEQVEAGQKVRDGLKAAAQAIIENVPPSADRTVALRKLREARMDANSAITHNGRY